MECGMTEREKRFRRREMLRNDYELTRGIERVERIKQRDRDIEMKQLSELERQRIELIEYEKRLDMTRMN